MENNDIIHYDSKNHRLSDLKDLKYARYIKLTYLFLEEFVNNKLRSKQAFCRENKISINTLNKYLNQIQI